MRVLLVEDDPALGASMKHALHGAGYTVDWTTAGSPAVAAAHAQDYAAILLDLSLQGMNGMDVLAAIRCARDDTPVLVVTANDARERKLEALDAGADDYIVKPFDLDELLARVRVHIRRRDGRASNLLSSRDVVLDLGAKVARREGAPVSVTAKEFRLLALLMRNAGRFVSRAELDSALYDEDSADVESNTIEVTIYGLRRKLGAAFIITARGLGYMVSS
ncbi:MAG TPA: response regulator transcription factor [Steroidobacteraceae bacterium]|nr:response regulator transcription factor [Steroidobacteraceae bacterium]